MGRLISSFSWTFSKVSQKFLFCLGFFLSTEIMNLLPNVIFAISWNIQTWIIPECSCKSCISLFASVRSAASSFSAGNGAGHQPAAALAVSYGMPTWTQVLLPSHQFSAQTFALNPLRQQKTQQGNQLAKETDRLMKAFTALPVSPDQVRISTIWTRWPEFSWICSRFIKWLTLIWFPFKLS